MGECYGCGKIYKSGAWYSKHMATCGPARSSSHHCNNKSSTQFFNNNYLLHSATYEEPQISCTICDKTYESRTEYEKHIETCGNHQSIAHTGSSALYNSNSPTPVRQTFSCSNCGKCYSSKGWYEKHVASCGVAASILAEKSSLLPLELHESSQTSTNTTQEIKVINFSCGHCGKNYKNEAWYKKHIATCSTDQQVVVTSVTVSNVTNDINNVNFNNVDQIVQSNHSSINFSISAHPVNFSCAKCGKTYKTEASYKKHVAGCNTIQQMVQNREDVRNVAEDTSTFGCAKCGKNYKTEAWYKKHVADCNTIQEIVQTSENARNNSKSTSDLNFCCAKCGKNYRTEAWYKKHFAGCNAIQQMVQNSEDATNVTEDTDNIKIGCAKCGKKFNSEAWYNKHITVCNNVDPIVQSNHRSINVPISASPIDFSCAKCGKNYKSVAWYKKHVAGCKAIQQMVQISEDARNVAEDTSAMDFSCTKCGKNYTAESYYKTHVAGCNTIQQIVQNSEDARNVAEDTNDINFGCAKCGKNYKTEVWYKKHVAACNTFTRVSATQHSINGIKSISNANFSCTTRPKTYKSNVQYQKHVVSCGKLNSTNGTCDSDNDAHLICLKCGKMYKKLAWYEKHVAECNIFSDAVLNINNVSNNNCRKADDLACQKCGSTYKSRIWYEKHLLACSCVLPTHFYIESDPKAHPKTNCDDDFEDVTGGGSYVFADDLQNCSFDDSGFTSANDISTCSTPVSEKRILSDQNNYAGYLHLFENHFGADKQGRELQSTDDGISLLGDELESSNTSNRARDMWKQGNTSDNNANIINGKTGYCQNEITREESMKQLKYHIKNSLILAKNFLEMERFVDNMIEKEEKYKMYITKLNKKEWKHRMHIKKLIHFYCKLITILKPSLELESKTNISRRSDFIKAEQPAVLDSSALVTAIQELLIQDQAVLSTDYSESYVTTSTDDDSLSDYEVIIDAVNEGSEQLLDHSDAEDMEIDNSDFNDNDNLTAEMKNEIENCSLLAANYLEFEKMSECLSENLMKQQKYISEMCEKQSKFKQHILKLVSCVEKLAKFMNIASYDEVSDLIGAAKGGDIAHNISTYRGNSNSNKPLCTASDLLLEMQTYSWSENSKVKAALDFMENYVKMKNDITF